MLDKTYLNEFGSPKFKLAESAEQEVEILFNSIKRFELIDKMYSISLFGSSIFESTVNDIDILFIVDLNDCTSKLELMSNIAERFRGNYSVPYQIDSNLPSIFHKTVKRYSENSKYEVESCVGPANIKDHTRPWVHLNGPMSISTWEAFTKHFPLQGYSISVNSITGFGSDISSNNISIQRNNIIEYATNMAKRLNVIGPSTSYLQKLLHVCAILKGYKYNIVKNCIQVLNNSKLLTNDDCRVIHKYLQGDANDNSKIKVIYDKLIGYLIKGD